MIPTPLPRDKLRCCIIELPYRGMTYCVGEVYNNLSRGNESKIRVRTRYIRGSSSVGRASAFQAARSIPPRFSLSTSLNPTAPSHDDTLPTLHLTQPASRITRPSQTAVSAWYLYPICYRTCTSANWCAMVRSFRLERFRPHSRKGGYVLFY